MLTNNCSQLLHKAIVKVCNAGFKAFLLASSINTLLIPWSQEIAEWLQELIPLSWLQELPQLIQESPQLIVVVLMNIILTVVFLIIGALVNKITIKVKSLEYLVSVEYGNILEQENCQKVINFDECYTTKVGNDIADIKPDSICGQYLKKHPDLTDLTIQELLNKQHIEKAPTPSKYQSKDRYEPGTIVRNGDDLLMAFTPLDEYGRGLFFNKAQYIQCLDKLWKELEKHQQSDICIPILGSGRTCFEDGEGASQQDFLDMIIWSYKLSSHKLKPQYKLRIICKRRYDFSINNIGRNEHKSKFLKILLNITTGDL